MGRKPRVYNFDFSIPVTSLLHDTGLNISLSRHDEGMLRIEVGSILYPLQQGDSTEISAYPIKSESISTTAYELGTGEVGTIAMIISDQDLDIETRTVSFHTADLIESRSVDVLLPETIPAFRIECRPPEKVKTFRSSYLAHTPIRRYMLDLKHIPYPVISDFLLALAEQHKTKYTDIKLIGVFDPVPMHLAKNLTIDTDKGILKYNIREKPVETSGRRIVRVVYGRQKSTGDIISAVFPVT